MSENIKEKIVQIAKIYGIVLLTVLTISFVFEFTSDTSFTPLDLFLTEGGVLFLVYFVVATTVFFVPLSLWMLVERDLLEKWQLPLLISTVATIEFNLSKFFNYNFDWFWWFPNVSHDIVFLGIIEYYLLYVGVFVVIIKLYKYFINKYRVSS